MARRERWDIIGSILLAVEAEHAEAQAPRVTKIADRANVAYDRLVGYLDTLRAAGLVAGDRVPALTPKGREFLAAYRAWHAFLVGMDVARPRALAAAGDEP